MKRITNIDLINIDRTEDEDFAKRKAFYAEHDLEYIGIEQRHGTKEVVRIIVCPHGHVLRRHGAALKPECEMCKSDRQRKVKAKTNLYKLTKESNFTVLDFSYENKTCTIECCRGHQKTVKYPISKTSVNCRECFLIDDKKRMIDKIESIIKDKGLWISGDYNGVNSKGKFRCLCGHEWSTRFGNVIEGKWCRACANRIAVPLANKAVTRNAVFRKINQQIQDFHSGEWHRRQMQLKLKKLNSKIRKINSQKKALEVSRIRYREKYNTDPSFRVNERIKNQIKKCITKDRSIGEYFKILGYETQDLMDHLEAKFKPGMSWENMGKWHIDHITPKTWFDFYHDDGTLNYEEFKRCWALDNLQPLWATENLIKGNRYLG